MAPIIQMKCACTQSLGDYWWKQEKEIGLDIHLAGRMSRIFDGVDGGLKRRAHGQRVPWSGKQQPTSVFLPGKAHGQRVPWSSGTLAVTVAK